jgi:hypothetical protein
MRILGATWRLLLQRVSGQPHRRLATYHEPCFWWQVGHNGPTRAVERARPDPTWANEMRILGATWRLLLQKISGQPHRRLATYREPSFWRQVGHNGPTCGVDFQVTRAGVHVKPGSLHEPGRMYYHAHYTSLGACRTTDIARARAHVRANVTRARAHVKQMLNGPGLVSSIVSVSFIPYARVTHSPSPRPCQIVGETSHALVLMRTR